MGCQTPLGAMESPPHTHTPSSRGGGGLITPVAAAEASVGPHCMSAGASVYHGLKTLQFLLALLLSVRPQAGLLPLWGSGLSHQVLPGEF